MCRLSVVGLALVTAVGCSSEKGGDDGEGARAADSGARPDPDAAAPIEPGPCARVDGAPVTVGSAVAADDYALVLPAEASSPTRWDRPGNEALVLDVVGSERGLIGQLVLHQGKTRFAYGMSLGRLAAGEKVAVQVSPLSAEGAAREACVGAGELTAAADLGDAAPGLVNAPIFRWPAAKRFDDLPVLVGWSAERQTYQAVYTTEDGGTVQNCGGGSEGIQAEIARWGRACDIEGMYTYGAAPRWQRCTGATAFSSVSPRLEGDHPIFYYGDGHNRLFESRAGYGTTCGSGPAEKSDGDLAGWNLDNPGSGPELDDGHVITIRPLPVPLDPLDYDRFGGRREGLVDVYAPWLYRLTFLELAREDKLDGERALPLEQYLYADFHVADVDGTGDRNCAPAVSGGFRVRAVTRSGAVIQGPQITAHYVSSDDDWKRIAIPVPAGTTAADIDRFEFDAYDGDGIYLLGLGDAFLVRPDGESGARLERLHEGIQELAYYVDDDSSGCTGGTNTDGPGGAAYPCAGSLVVVRLP